MAAVTKTKTWTYAEASAPTAAHANANFDTLYAALTAGGQVSHVDASQAFTSLNIIDIGTGVPSADTAGINKIISEQQFYEFHTSTTCCLHGTHSPASAQVLSMKAGTQVITVNASGTGTLALPTPAFATDLLSVILVFGDAPGVSAGTSQLYIDRASSTLSSVVFDIFSASVTIRLNYFVVGW